MAYVIETLNPFEPFKAVKHVVPDGTTIRSWVQTRHPETGEFPIPTVCTVNGIPVKRKDWDREMKENDVVTFVAMPADLVTIVLIILVVVAIGVSLYLALNTPKAPGEQPGSDPVFSVKGQENTIRLGEPIECCYGRNRIFPSLASRPYYEYRDNEQFQFALFCLGQGEYDISAIQIGDTAIDSFEEVEYEVLPPGSPVTLFPNAVYTSAEAGGQTLYGPNEPEYPVDGWVGPFAANPPGTEATKLAIDVVFPKGLYRVDSKNKLKAMGITFEVQIRLIDDAGAPLGAWEQMTGSPFTVEGKTTTPQRRTFEDPVATGRYEVRIRRTVDTGLTHNVGHEIVWEALRAYVDEEQDFGDVTLLAVRIRATNNLNDRTQLKFNVIATRKLPIRASSGEWTAPTATRSIIWAFVDVFRSNYGGRISDDDFFDWETLEQLDATYQALGHNFDWIFRDPITVWEAARTVARVGRATPILAGSLITLKRNAAQELPVMLFNQENIIQGTFNRDTKLWDLDEYDSLQVEYTEPATGYKQEQVMCILPGGTGDHPQDVRFPGIQDRTHAYREGMHLLAIQTYLRQNITFETGLEGFIATFGDLIAVVHDVPNWGQGGYVVHAVEGVGGNYHLYLSEPLDWSESNNYQIMFRGRRGEVIGPFTAIQVADPMQVQINPGQEIDFLLGGENEPMLFTFGVTNNTAEYLRVVKIEPQGGEAIRVTAVPEDTRIHSFDTLSPTALSVPASPPVNPALPEINNLRLTQIDSAAHIVQASWDAAFGAQYYIIQTSQDEGENWSDTITTTRTSVQFQTFPGDLLVRVAAVNEGQGPWAEESLEVGYLLGLILADEDVWRIEWQLVLLAKSYIVRVYDNTTSEPELKRIETRFARSFEYTYEDAVEDDNVVRSILVTVTPDFEDDEEEVPAELVIENAIPEAPQNPGHELIGEESPGQVVYRLFWDVPEEADLIRIKVWLSAVNGFDPEVVTPILDSTLSEPGFEDIPTEHFVAIDLDSNNEHAAHYWRVALFDGWGNEISTNVTPQQTIPPYV